MLTENFNKPLSEATIEEIQGLISGEIAASNPLFSEELTMANREIRGIGKADLTDALTQTAQIVMTGAYAPGTGEGFSLRNGIGLGVQRMLRDGDTATLDRLNASVSNPLLKASLRALKAELKVHCVETGINVHSKELGAVKPAAAKPA